MPLLGDLLGAFDRARKSAASTLSDLVFNPSLWIDQMNDRAANFNRNVEPVISGGLLQNRPLTEEEIQKKHTDLAMSFAPIGMTAWHGSPYKFDKFSLDKIGTGEGAQAYGHGLYLAESPAVATEYQKNLSQFSRIDGKPLVGNKTISSGARTYLLAENADLPKAIQNARDAIARKPDNELLPPILKELESLNPDSITKSSAGNLYKTDIPEEAVARFLDWDKPLSQQAPEVQKALSKYGDSDKVKILDLIRSGAQPDGFGVVKSGSGYAPVINGEVVGIGTKDLMMPTMDDALGYVSRKIPSTDPTASSIYRRMVSERGGADAISQAEVSNLLQQKGIPGIRYLDGNSRPKNVIDKRLYSLWEENGKNAEAAVDQYMRGVHNTPARKQQIRDGLLKELQAYQGTSNFVVFDPEMIRILERNGQATGAAPWKPGEWRPMKDLLDVRAD